MLSILLTFVTRAVFVRVLSVEYLGIESLFSNVLAVLSLAELGVGSAIIYALYKPIAEDDVATIKSLMRLFKRAYCAIGCVIFVLGLCLAPFLDLLIEDAPDIPYLKVYFFCFVANTGVSYFFSYKSSLLFAYQKEYINSLIRYGVQIVISIIQIAVLLATHNYLLFLFCMVTGTLAQNICISRYADKHYPYLSEKDVRPIERGLLSVVKQNVFAMTIHKVAQVASVPIGSIVISKFVGIDAIAIYGNYVLIINALWKILDKVFDAMIASVGNLSAKESLERQYEVFSESYFVNAVLYAVASSVLLCCATPFIELWLGEGYLFNDVTLFLLVAWFYVRGIRSAELAFTSANGLYRFTWYKAIIEAVVMVVGSIALVQIWGVDGVVVSGIVSMLLVATTMEVYVLYKRCFKSSPIPYLRKSIIYYGLTALCCVLSWLICHAIPYSGFFALIGNGCIAVVVSAALFAGVFWKSREFKEFVGLAKRVFGFAAGKMRKGRR